MLPQFQRGRLGKETLLYKAQLLYPAAGVAQVSMAEEGCGPLDLLKEREALTRTVSTDL